MAAGLLLLALLAGCARPALQESPDAPAKRSDAASHSPEPALLAFTLEVNGQAVKPGETVEADFGESTELLFRFPVPINRYSVERIRDRLPERTSLAWLDDRTCLMLVPPGESFTIHPVGAESQDGSARAGDGFITVNRKSYPRVTLYRPDDLAAGKKQPVARWRLPYRPDGFALSPDRSRALLYPSDPMVGGPDPSLIDLETGEESPIPLKAEHGWFSAGGWLPDGRLYLLSSSLFVSDSGGAQWREVTKDLFSWVAELSPQGSHLALWSPLDMDHLTVIDLATGAKRQVAGPFRRPGADAAIRVAWSPDGRWLAGSDFENEATGEGGKIRVVDPFGEEPGWVHAGPSLVTWLTTGDLVGSYPPLDRKVDETGHLVLVRPDGTERELLDRWARPSPDGRYLAYTEWTENGSASFLVEVATGAKVRVPLPHTGRWTDQNEWLIIEG